MADQYDELFAPLTFGQTYKRAFVIFRRRWGAFLCLAFCTLAPYLVLVLTVGIMESNTHASTGEIDGFGVFAAALAVEFIIIILLTQIAIASMTWVVAESYAGYTPSGWLCIKKTFSRLCTLLCCGLVMGLVVFVSIILPLGLFSLYANTGSSGWLAFAVIVSIICFAWLVYFSVAVTCAWPAIILEPHLSAINGMKRSHSLSGGYLCYIFGVTALIWIAAFVVVVVFGPFAQIAHLVLVPLHVM